MGKWTTHDDYTNASGWFIFAGLVWYATSALLHLLPYGNKEWHRIFPRPGVYYLLADIIRLDVVSKKPPEYLYISDGGHIENIGLLPLLKRRCNTIYAFDAGSDPTGEKFC